MANPGLEFDANNDDVSNLEVEFENARQGRREQFVSDQKRFS